MTTATDIIQDALEMLQVYAPGETMTSADANRGLTVLNDMLDSWSNESLACYAILEQSHVLTAGVSAYTIGTGGTFNMTRPLRLINGPGAAYLQDTNGNNYGVDVVPRDVWNTIGNRSSSVTSNYPDTLFYDPQYPLGVLNFFPVPNLSGVTAFWDSYLQISEFASLSATLSLPPGYALALKSNLAIECEPYWGVTASDKVMLKASRSKGAIKRTNNRPNIAQYDREIVSNAGNIYNIYSDRPARSL